MGAALWGPGRKPRVSIWGLLVHLLAVIAHQLLPARGGIEEADLESRAGDTVGPGASPFPFGCLSVTHCGLRQGSLRAGRWGVPALKELQGL